MPLLLLDLDNTLIDRDAAYRATLLDFLAEHGLPEGDIEWLMSVDASGYTPRPEVARAMHGRYGDRVPGDAVNDKLDRGAGDRVVLSGPLRGALARGRTPGWTQV
ncbi:HAD family hydrolase, partial [Streptomyces sp. NPDC006265]